MKLALALLLVMATASAQSNADQALRKLKKVTLVCTKLFHPLFLFPFLDKDSNGSYIGLI